MTDEAVRGCFIALIILLVLAGLSAYNQLWIGAKIFGITALIPACILAAVGWNSLWKPDAGG
jgi:hypothetical protein